MMQSEYARYSCQLSLPDFGAAAQKKMEAGKVLLIGMGGLGCPVAQYLVASGVGTIGMVDYDIISNSNLHRQILYAANEVGKKKVAVAASKLSLQNPSIRIIPFDVKVKTENIFDLINSFDVIVDATDNFESHYLINDACVLVGKPVVFGAIYQYEGQVAVWNVGNEKGTFSPNYRDVFPTANTLQIPDCTDGGVLPTIAGIIGCMQANEVIKLLTNNGTILAGKLLILDAKTLNSQIINIGSTTRTQITALRQEKDIEIISKEVFERILDNEDYLFVDVRTKEEYESFNIGGINIPISEMENSLNVFSQKKPIVLYCASGKRSLIAAKWLQEKIPEKIIMSLEDGLNGK